MGVVWCKKICICVLQGVCLLHGGLFVAACWFVVGVWGVGCCVSGSDFAHLPGIVATWLCLYKKEGRHAKQGGKLRLIHSWLFECGNFWHGWP